VQQASAAMAIVAARHDIERCVPGTADRLSR
jgi:hypothetical protein